MSQSPDTLIVEYLEELIQIKDNEINEIKSKLKVRSKPEIINIDKDETETTEKVSHPSENIKANTVTIVILWSLTIMS